MSWSSVLATGSGGTEFRLVIEGLDTEFVTSTALERTVFDGRVRRVGLKRDSIELQSGSGIITGKLEASGFAARIVDVDGAATAVFSTDATRTTFATLDLTTSGSTLTVVSTAGWPTTGTLHAGTECMAYNGTTATTFTNLTRGRWNTIPQAHFSALTTEQSRRTEITNRPVTIEGRRAYVFAYGDGDDLQGNGTQVFIGIVARDATLSNSVEWTLAIDGMTRILDAELAGPGDGSVSPRGIYYPWNAPLRVSYRQRTTNAFGDALDATRNTLVLFTGFYETQDAFCAALQSAIAAVTVGWETQVSIVSQGDAGWYPAVRVGATARWPTIVFSSYIDPTFSTEDAYGFTDNGYIVDPTLTVAANTTYRIVPRSYTQTDSNVSERYVLARGSVPRGMIGFDFNDGINVPTNSATFPENRIYLQTIDNIATATAIVWNDGNVGADLLTFDASATSRYVRIQSTTPTAFPFAGAGSVAFSFSRQIYAAFPDRGLANVIAWLIANSAAVCNLGGTPLLTSSDFDAGYVSQITGAHRGKPLATQRNFWAPKKAKFLEWLAEECKLIGVFPALNANGQIKFVPVKLRADTEASGGIIDASSQLSSVGFPGWERSAMGTLNSVVFKTGYNINDDKHEGTIYNFRDVTAFSRSKMPRVLEIAPKSSEAFGPEYDLLPDLTDLTSSVLGIFGRPYRVASISVPWSLFSLTPGDLVTITSAQIPNTDGTRGVTQQQGLVLSKRFRANDAHGTIEVLIHGQNIAGYVPFSRITAATGTNPTLTLTLGLSTIPGSVDVTPWQIGWEVRAIRYDNASTANDRSGVITAKAGATVTVTFDSSWTFSGVNHLVFAPSTDVSPNVAATAAQTRWAYVARSTALIRYAGTIDAPARTFAP